MLRQLSGERRTGGMLEKRILGAFFSSFPSYLYSYLTWQDEAIALVFIQRGDWLLHTFPFVAGSMQCMQWMQSELPIRVRPTFAALRRMSSLVFLSNGPRIAFNFCSGDVTAPKAGHFRVSRVEGSFMYDVRNPGLSGLELLLS